MGYGQQLSLLRFCLNDWENKKSRQQGVRMPLEAIGSIRLRRKAMELFGLTDETANIEDHLVQNQIRLRYRQFARQFHPDLNPGNQDEATRRMAEIIGAYKILLKPKTPEEEHMERFYDGLGFI